MAIAVNHDRLVGGFVSIAIVSIAIVSIAIVSIAIVSIPIFSVASMSAAEERSPQVRPPIQYCLQKPFCISVLCRALHIHVGMIVPFSKSESIDVINRNPCLKHFARICKWTALTTLLLLCSIKIVGTKHT